MRTSVRIVKRCGRCGEVKPFDAFHRRGSKHQAWCKPCRKEYDAKYFQDNKHRRTTTPAERNAAFRAWYRALKSDPCADCGQQFPPEAMQWDHRPSEMKVAEVGWLASRHCRRKVLEEIAKCDLVCANCHAVRTRTRHAA